MDLRAGTKISVQTFTTKIGTPSSLTDLDGRSHFEYRS
jgi:hypothetical protein